MINSKATYDYGTGVLEIDLGGDVTELYLSADQFDSIVKQLAEVCTAGVMKYSLGYDAGYADGFADAEVDTDDRYDEGYDDGYQDGYEEAREEFTISEDDEDDE